MNLIIRPVRESDAPAITEIRRQPTVSEYNNTIPSDRGESDRRNLTNLGPDDHVLVAEEGGAVVGFALLSVFRNRQRHVGNLSLNVHDAHQNRGSAGASSPPSSNSPTTTSG